MPPRSQLCAATVLTLLSLAWLAWAATASLPAAFAWADAAPAEYVLEALPPDAGNGRGVVDVIAVLADGLFRRRSELRSEGEWESPQVWQARVTLPAAAPARIHLRARTLCVACWVRPDGGRIRIAGGGHAIERDLRGDWQQVWIDLPPAPPPPFLLPVVLLLLLGLAAAVQPWRLGRRAELWLLLHLLLLHLLYWGSQPIAATGDTPGYLEGLAPYLQEGRIGYFPPGYGLFLGACGIAGDRLGLLATLLQHAMSIACFLGLYAMLRRPFGQLAALAVCLVGGSLLPALATPQMAISEQAALFGMGFGLWLAWAARARGSRMLAVAAGLLFGWAGLARVVPLAAALPSAAAIHLLPWRQRRPHLLLLTAGTALLVLLMSLAWSGLRTGRWALSDGVQKHLFNHFVSYQQLLGDGPATRELQALVGARDLRQLHHWDLVPAFEAHRYPYQRSLDLIGSVAWEAAATATPLQHLGCVLGLAWKNWHAEPFASAPSMPWMWQRLPAIENRPLLHVDGRGLRWYEAMLALHRWLWPAITWLAVLGLLLWPWCRDRFVLLAIGWLAAGYLLATSCVEYFLERYNIAVHPFVVAMAAVPLVLLAQAARQLAVRRRRAGAQAPDPQQVAPSIDATP